MNAFFEKQKHAQKQLMSVRENETERKQELMI